VILRTCTLLIVVSLLVCPRCNSTDGLDQTPERTKLSETAAPCVLENTFASPQDLGHAIVEALNAKDSSRLHSFRITKEEYLEYLWPEFPARKNWPGDYAYANLNKNCIKGVNRWSTRLGGLDLTFVGIRFTDPTEKYDRFNLLRGTILSVRTKDGLDKDLEILGSFVEMGNCYKLLSYDEG